MKWVLVITAGVLTLAWLPLALRFNHGWKTRRNPVSLAICAAILLFVYTDVMYALAISDVTTWRFFAIATHIFEAVVVVNFYAAFYWSDRRFADARSQHVAKTEYTIPPPNSTSTPRRS
jgi:hypothetical protein